MKIIFSFLLSLFTVMANAQSGSVKASKKAINLYNLGLEKAQNGEYPAAIKLIGQAIELNAYYVDAYLTLGGIYGEMKDYEKSIVNYEKGFALDSVGNTNYLLPYAINLAGTGAFEKALIAVDRYLQNPNLNENARKAGEFRKRCFEFAVRFKQTHPAPNYVFAPVNLGDSVNSADLEYYPSLTVDNKTLVFTRRVRGTNEDFFVSSRNREQWKRARGIDGDINTNFNEGAQNISQDGQWLVFTGCNFPVGEGSCDLYLSVLTKKGWSPAENLGDLINTEGWESSPCLSPDKRELYFSSNREGGMGGKDIYVSTRSSDGSWSEPRNLGPTINTSADESCPFVHADNQTLYFTSNGLPGYGGDDLFLIRKQPGGDWGEPENLGYPINTILNEGSLVISSDGLQAYYASDRTDTRGGLDIYQFELREDIRPKKTLWVQGKVFDKTSKQGLPSAVELINLTTGLLLSKVQTDEEGNYLITLPTGNDYAFNVNRKGYLFFSANFPLSGKTPDSTYQMDIPLQPLQVNASIVLNNIFFEVNQYDLEKRSTAELDKIIQLLNENPSLRIRIGGHTDNTGKPADNLTLSNNRTLSVVKYLVSKGVRTGRLQGKGYGATQPVGDNSTDEGRAKNRRTELTVIAY